MKAAVVYESVFGNTHEVAEAVAEGLGEVAEVTVRAVTDARVEDVAGMDLLVLGGPTHAHGMVSHLTMKGAAEDARKHERDVPDPAAPVLRDLLSQLPEATGRRAAAFDTRIGKPKVVTGSAAKGIAKRLRRHGYELVAEPESFVVDDTHGPLHAGELERARQWGRDLAKTAG
jgi:flavodoxin